MRLEKYIIGVNGGENVTGIKKCGTAALGCSFKEQARASAPHY
jgi:hypothetical protein